MNERQFRFCCHAVLSVVLVCLATHVTPVRADEVGVLSVDAATDGYSSGGLGGDESYNEDASAWEFFTPVSIPELSGDETVESDDQLIDVILTPDVFQYARSDLADLRLFDAQDNTVPYRLRTLCEQSIQTPLSATEFNRSEPVGGPQEVTLEIAQPQNNQSQNAEHNEIRIETSGQDFRRAFTVSGSDDGEKWKLIASGNLIRFKEAGNSYQRDSIIYPSSRLRMVRIVVEPDRSIKDKFKIARATVIRQHDLPGEMVTIAATVQAREPGRVNGASGSSWIFDLGGSNIPCHQLEVDVSDPEFARDVQLEQEVPARFGPTRVFSAIYLPGENIWQRRSSEPQQPMTIGFSEIQSSRLRLKITDHRNKPLTITAARTVAAARQLVFARPQPDQLPLKMYFGNPDADLPNYDFARNLPEQPAEKVARATLAVRETNSSFTPPPKALTERLPWLIYVVLGFVSAVLATVITSLSRSAIAVHDGQE